MEIAWILLGFAGWVIGIFLVLVILQVTGDQQDVANGSEHGIAPKTKAPPADPDPQPHAGERP